MADELVEKVRYEADITDISSKIDKIGRDQDGLATDTERQAGRMSTGWDKVTGGIGKAAKAVGIGALAFGGAAAIIGPAILSQGAQLEALGNKSATVFEGALADVQAWASGSAGAMGMTRDELTGVAAGFADLLKPMGFTADEAARMSTATLDLSGALSAWTGGQRSAAEVSAILAKAMLGEREGLKELGISISEADVQARLLKNGTSELTGAALEQAKALATQELILEKSTDAQKAWSDGSMDAIKAQNESKASLSNLKETLVRGIYPALQSLLPVITSVATWLGDRVPAAISAGQKAWQGLQDVIGWLLDHKPILIGAATAIAIGLGAMFVTWAAGAASAAVATIAATWPIIAIGVAIAALVAGVIYAYEHWGWFRTAVDAVASFMTDTLWPALKDVFGYLQDNVPPIISAVIGWFQQMWDKSEGVRAFLVGAFTVALDAIVTTFGVVWGAISTYAGWLQTAWDKSENLRSMLAGGLSTAIDAGKIAIDAIWGALETMGVWLQNAWDRTETLRALIAGGFTSALGGLRTAFDQVKAVIQPIYDLLAKTWEVMQKVMGGGDVAKGLSGPMSKTSGGSIPQTGSIIRIHEGGRILAGSGQTVAGFGALRADEVPAILQRGETVFRPEQLAAVLGAGRDRGPVMHVETQNVYSNTDAAGVAQRITFALAGR